MDVAVITLDSERLHEALDRKRRHEGLRRHEVTELLGVTPYCWTAWGCSTSPCCRHRSRAAPPSIPPGSASPWWMGPPEQDAWLAACVAEAGADLAARLAIPRGPRGPQARHEISCLNCGRQVMAGNSRAKFCDQRCRYAYRRDHPAEPWERDKQRTCEVCGETFLAAKSTARYCPGPKDCATRAYRKRYEDRKAAGLAATEAKVYRRKCVMCRETFDTSKPGAKYCGDRCRTAAVRARRQAGLTVPSPARGKRLIHQRTCEVCGGGFMSAKPDGRFCSDNCRAKAHYQANRTAILAQRARVWSERKTARLSS